MKIRSLLLCTTIIALGACGFQQNPISESANSTTDSSVVLSNTSDDMDSDAQPDEALKTCNPEKEHLVHLNKITDTTLRTLLGCFEYVKQPFVVSISTEDENAIEQTEIIKRYLIDMEVQADEDSSVYEDELRRNQFYYGQVFYSKDEIGIIFGRFYSPGAFGINNQFAELLILDYSGKEISRSTLGCISCYDTNMGSNDYYASSDSILVLENSAKVWSRNIHATLIESEDDSLPPFHEEKKDSSVIQF